MNRNLRLLVVDDERNMRESLKTVLESRGTLVDTVESAEQGLTSIEASDYFMVITCLLYTSPSPRDATLSRMPSSA